MVDSPLAEEPLSATQPAITPAVLSVGGGPRENGGASVHTTLVIEGDNRALSPVRGLSSPFPAFVGITNSIRKTEDTPPAELYPPLVPLPTPRSMTFMGRSSAHSETSISPFRHTSKGLPDETDIEKNISSETSLLQGTSENIDPVQHQMEQQQQEPESSLKNGRSSFTASSVERLASSHCSSPLLEEMASPGSREAAPASSSASSEQHEAAAHMPEQRIDAAWQRHVRSWCSAASSLDSSVSDLRLREETRRNTKRNASPLSARNLRAKLQQKQREQQRSRKSSSPLRSERTEAAVSSSAPTTPLRFHVVSWRQQRQDRSNAHTPSRSHHAGTTASPCVAAAIPAVAAVAAATATPTAERPATGGSAVRSILRAASASGSANSVSVRRVVFTPVPKSQRLASGEGMEASPWLEQRGAADGEADPGASAAAALEPGEADTTAPVPDCGEPPPAIRSDSVPTLEQEQRQEEQQHGMPFVPTEPERRPSEHNRCSADDSSDHREQRTEQPEPSAGRDEAQQQPQEHSEGAQGDAAAAEVQLEAEPASEGMAAADAGGTTAAAIHAQTQVTRAPSATEAVTSGGSTSEPASDFVEASTDLEAPSEDSAVAMEAHECGPAAEAAAEAVISSASAAEMGADGGPGEGAKENTAEQALQVPSVAAAQFSAGEAAGEAEPAGVPSAAGRSDCSPDSLKANGGSISNCSSSARVVVVSNEGETEVLLPSASCLVAPALSEPLGADPTPLRKAPAKPPAGPEARGAATKARASAAGAPSIAASAGSPAAADGAVVDAPTATAAEKKTPPEMNDEVVDSLRGQAAMARDLSLQQQQQHGYGPVLTSDEDTGITPESDSVIHQENETCTAEVEAHELAAVATATPGLAAGQTDTDGGYSSPPSQTAACGQMLEQPQHQQQNVSDEGELASHDASEASSTPVTPFAGPDPLSGDAPLSPRLAVPSGRGGSRIVSTSAMSFLLSVRHQLEAEAAVQQLHEQEQRHVQQEQQEDAAPFHGLHEPSLPRERCETKEESSQVEQQQRQELEQQEQQQLDAKEPQQQLDEAIVNPSTNQQQQHEVEGVRTPGVSCAAVEGDGVDALADAAVSAVAAVASSSRCSSGCSGSPSEAPLGLATPFKHSRKNSGARSADIGSTSSRSSSSSALFSGGTSSVKEGNSGSSNPQWRTQWRALDALTNRLLQGLPRALTVIAEGEGGSPSAAREPEAAVAVAPSAPEARETGAAELSGKTDSDIPRMSWVDYREERLREVRGPRQEAHCRTWHHPPHPPAFMSRMHPLPVKRLIFDWARHVCAFFQLQLCDGDRHEMTHRDDIYSSGFHEGDEFSEVQQLLKHHLMKRGFGVASAAAEQLLMQPAKTRSEWNDLCGSIQESLQQQLRQQIEPLAQQMTRELQQLEGALEAAASRAEGVAEAKRLRLSRESWESGFVALAEERHVALQCAASNVDAAAASLGRLLEEETQLAEEISAMKAEIRGFDNTSGDLRLLADIRHKESIVKAFERLSGVRIQRVSTTGLVAELAWPRSLPAVAALQIPADTCIRDAVLPQESTSKVFSSLYGAADYPAASTRITISWSREDMRQTELQRRTQPAPVPFPRTTPAAGAISAAAAEPATPIRQRVQIVRPCLPPGGLPPDSAVCTPLLASRRERAYGADAGASADVATPAAAGATAGRTVRAVSQRDLQQPQSAASGEPRFLPITSCKLQSRFPVLRAVAAVATSGTVGDASGAEALPPHRRWMFTVEQLRYFLLGAVQRSLQQMLLQQGSGHGGGDGLTGVSTGHETFCATSAAGATPGSHLPNFGMRGLSGSADMSSRSSTETGSSSRGADAAEGLNQGVGAPPFPDLSTVRALLLHAHAAAGRVALLHDQLLLLLHAFTSVTSVGFDGRGEDSSLPHLIFKTFLAPSNDEFPVLQLCLTIDLSEALVRGSLLLAIEGVEVKCLSALDDMCTDGQEACKALHGALQGRLEALWDSEKQTLSSEGCIKAFSDQGLVECVYSACDECGYSCAVEDWRLDRGATACRGGDDFISFASWGSAEAGALGRWTALLEDVGIVPELP
ncbi:hypothetical protein, conserved [Eimeria praecox]|uniref:Uncharacterized protein n=1 Tax=Eimeria praecox TaxID=51316 RepID=U6G664_9EIME|nr:hypothetical protein, conserved [Eimeria praecox]